MQEPDPETPQSSLSWWQYTIMIALAAVVAIVVIILYWPQLSYVWHPGPDNLWLHFTGLIYLPMI